MPARAERICTIEASPRRPQPDEERDEHQEGVGEQPHEAEQHGHRLADPRRDLRGPEVVHPEGQQAPQDAPAIHGESGKQVEHRETHVDPEQLIQEAAADPDHLAVGCEPLAQLEYDKQDGREHHVHRRARKGHQQLLLRVLRHAVQPGDSTDRQQRDVACRDAEPPGGQRVSELVEHDDRE